MRIADLYQREISYAKAILPILADKRCDTITPTMKKKRVVLLTGRGFSLLKRKSGKERISFTGALHLDRKTENFLYEKHEAAGVSCSS